MTNPDPDTVVRRFIDGDLPDEHVQEALHHIADDPEARSLLQFELRMTQDLAASPSSEPSPAFAPRTVNRLARADASTSSLGSRLKDWWRAVTTPPIVVPVRPVTALTTLVVLVGLALMIWPETFPTGTTVAPRTASNNTGTVQTAAASTGQTSNTVWTRFVYVDDEANSVAVAGDFSQWDSIPLSPRKVNDKTVWTGLVRVPRGQHEYQYVIDGEKWVTDPLAPVKRSDGFGTKNAVLEL